MNEWHPYLHDIHLFVEGRIEEQDAKRQEVTAHEILRRLANQPGLVLADEVGMGKTFVALAVATSVALSDSRRRPVVVMVPPSLKEKWPQDFAVFSDRCLPPSIAREIRGVSADSAVDFLKILDDTKNHRRSIVFLTHGAMHRELRDGWVKLAMIQRALHRRHHTRRLRRALSRCAGQLLRLGWVTRSEEIWGRLLDASSDSWLRILKRNGIKPEGDENQDSDSDPVPRAVVEVLRDFDATKIYEALQEIPQRQSSSYDERVKGARGVLTELWKDVWSQCLTRLDFKLPLLVLDEAHHLKNPETRLAGLFQNPEAKGDAEEIARGALGNMFERMLFLTATPFQLGHHELCSVLERFVGIAWKAPDAPVIGRDAFRRQVHELREGLDAAQTSALNLDAAWGLLRTDDLTANGQRFAANEIEAWWAAIQSAEGRTPAAERVLFSYLRTFERMRTAESALQPWVIRHLKERIYNGHPRREQLPGQAIQNDIVNGNETGIEVSGKALLPFLLAARATACAPDSRPVFAEGLASSYEAFLHTRKAKGNSTDADDDEAATGDAGGKVGEWYLNKLETVLPLRDHRDSAAHPKIEATAKRALDAWQKGEKVVVFCHYVATGRVLRQVISGFMRDEIVRRGAEKLGCAPNKAAAQLERIGKRFFDIDSPIRRACDEEVTALLSCYPKLTPHADSLLEMTRRYLRTPSFLARFFPLGADRLGRAAVKRALASGDGSGLKLSDVLHRFFDFLENRCVEAERVRYLEAIRNVQTGTITGLEVQKTFSEDELQRAAREQLLPNVRLVNGDVKSETRQRLMLTFNSPFFPEVVIASSVMAEGVDLHRFCRYVIHHDLCWNPSTLEQRTGRVDRIGSKAERCGQPIRVYLPYLAETQDEKQYRVVMDRERWFSVVMGEKFKVDARNTEKLACRIPLPESVAEKLAFRLVMEKGRA
jgi:Helicase conserved C-terminal domain/SNF2-related domain